MAVVAAVDGVAYRTGESFGGSATQVECSPGDPISSIFERCVRRRQPVHREQKVVPLTLQQFRYQSPSDVGRTASSRSIRPFDAQEAKLTDHMMSTSQILQQRLTQMSKPAFGPLQEAVHGGSFLYMPTTPQLKRCSSESGSRPVSGSASSRCGERLARTGFDSPSKLPQWVAPVTLSSNAYDAAGHTGNHPKRILGGARSLAM
mmetsp:Transcript_33106/g.60702  ORF Transcript_33106/g.60702 Transcript_33106/m.60702 type:complete len:204 (+) Transcript_33106:122-733(+)